MKAFIEKVTSVFKWIFGYGILLCLFVGGLTFFGYLAAMVIGGDVAEAICVFIYKTVMPVMIYAATVLVLLGLVTMYLKGEIALTPEKTKKNRK